MPYFKRVCFLVLMVLAGVADAQDRDRVCLSHAGELTTDATQSLQTLMEGMEPVFRDFPVYQDLIRAMGTDICFSDSLRDALGYFSPEDNSIVLQGDLPDFLQVAILIHELRHLQQFATGNCPTDRLAMSETALATFALEADASAISLLVAHALKDAGHPGIWDALWTWPTHADIAAAFRSEIDSSGDPRRATAAAFTQWYMSSQRRENYYYASCSSYLDRLDRTKALPQYEKIAPGFFQGLCRMPDGSPYECQAPSDGFRP